MIITCDECESSFSVNDSLIKDTGSKVRCSKCDSVFVAYPQAAVDIEALETDDPDLTLDPDDQMLGEDDDLGLDDLDSDLGDFLDEDEAEADETLAMASDTEESELDLDDFDEMLDEDTGLESDDDSAQTEGELELDLDFDLGEESDPDELEDLADLDEKELSLDEADSELEDFDFDLESEPDEALELEGDEKLDLTDLGLEEEDISALEKPSDEEELSLQVDESDALDLSDLELALDDDMPSEDSTAAAADELSLDIADEEPGVAETAEADLEVEETDELDLSDLDIEMEDAAVSEDASAAGSEDMDLDLDLDMEAEAIASSEEIDDDELDLSDLTGILEEEEAPAAAAQAEELGLEMELEGDAATGADEPDAVADSEEIDELDLSDLEDFMATAEAPAAQLAADDSTQDLEMDLDFQLDDSAQAGEVTTDSASSDELDFSDLEQMLESDETPSIEATDSSNDEELELQFSTDEPPAAGTDLTAAEDTGAAVEDDDFLDIEQLLEEGEDSALSGGGGLDGDVTDLPLEMEAALDDASKGAEAELELDFDLESELQEKEDLLDTSESTENQLESNLLASDEVDFLEEAGVEETEFRDHSSTSVISTDDFASEELAETDSAYGATHVLPGSEEELAAAGIQDQGPVAYQPPKVRSKKPVLVVVLLFLLAVGAVIIPNMLGIKIPYLSDVKIPYLSDLDVKIPYLSDWLNPEPQDVAGNLKIIPLGETINGKFVDNARSGQLFVIQGQIENVYDHPRSHIKVTGKLYLKGKKIAKKTTVYCGNLLSSSELATMDIATINKKLSIQSGDRRSNFKVATRKRVPFMIVFDKLPRNLDEFTVEVESSSI